MEPSSGFRKTNERKASDKWKKATGGSKEVNWVVAFLNSPWYESVVEETAKMVLAAVGKGLSTAMFLSIKELATWHGSSTTNGILLKEPFRLLAMNLQ